MVILPMSEACYVSHFDGHVYQTREAVDQVHNVKCVL